MKIEELKTMIGEVVKAEIEPLKQPVESFARIAGGTPDNPGSAPGMQIMKSMEERRADERRFLKGGIVRAIRAIAMAKKGMHPADFARRTFPEDEVLIKALGTDTGAAGGWLIPENYSQDVIDALYPKSIVRAAGAQVITIDNNISIPKVTAGGTGYWVGDNVSVTTSEQTFGQVKLNLKKMACLVPVSNDLLKNSSPSAEEVVRRDLLNVMAKTEDIAFLRGPGTEYAPKGIRFWANTIETITATPTFTTMITDLQDAIGAVEDANVSTDESECAWLMAPRTRRALMKQVGTQGERVFAKEMAESKTLEGFRFFSSTNIPTNLGTGSDSELMFVNMKDVLIGQGSTLRIDLSTEASYAAGGSDISSFQYDQTLIRVISEVDLVLRYAQSAHVYSDVTWGT